ncbi:MAG: magnesium transporter [Methanophagales archaeon]|nr:magnesium transporter [Methanophagales archaeon]
MAVNVLIPLSNASSFFHNNSEIQELIEEKNWRQLKDTLSVLPAPDIANLLESLGDEWKVIIFRLLPQQLAAEVFGELDSNKQISLLQQMNDERVRDIILALSPDDRTDLFEELPGKVTQRLLNLLPPEERSESLQLLGYPEESVGRLMTPDHVAIRPHWSIKEASEQIRRYGRDAETINMIYVVDDEWHLIGDIPLRRLILADPEQTVESIMNYKFVSISAFDDQEKAVRIMQRYDLIALPVVDLQNILLGIVTVDDMLDVLEEEVTEDIQKGASVVPLTMSYTAASSWTLFHKRIVWLLSLLVAGILSGSVIAHFEKIIGVVIALVFFIPLLIDTGGNTGTQSATLIIRAIATGDLTLKKWFSVMKKELLVGILLAGTMGLLIYLLSYLWKGDPGISLVVGVSMIVITLWANLVGSLLPILLTKIKLDPAMVSSPLITTIMDVTGLLIYFSVAVWLL